MKRLLSAILSVVILLGITPVAMAEYNDIDVSNDYYNSALRLQDLDIISGYDDGSFQAENNISRAEFTKIVVCMMGKEDEAKTATSSSTFFDVERGYWATPYINYAVSKSILAGYSDGSFGPKRNISYAEAVTILLRTIGYMESDVGYFWPNNYLDAAASLGITSGMEYQPGEAITRGDAAILTDRTLFAKPSESMGKDTYIETVGYTVLDDALILDKDSESNSVTVLSGNLKLGVTSTYIKRTQIEVEEGEVYKHAVIDKDGYLAALNEYTDTVSDTKSETVTVKGLTNNTIEYIQADGVRGTYKPEDNFIMYYNNNKMTFASAKSYLLEGTDITFYGKEQGLWNIAVIGETEDVAPVLASHDYTDSDVSMEGIKINKDNLVVYRDGKGAELSNIKAYDAVYYNTKTNTMDVYSKKITGIYYEAKPSKAYVESITVGGKDYEIGYTDARDSLNASNGAFEIGDKITLILGKDDKVVFVTEDVSGVDYFSYGVVLSTSLKTAQSGPNEGNTEFVTSMFMTNGEVQEIVTDKLYKDNVGDLMNISYTDGVATLTNVTVNKNDKEKYCGAINVENRTIGNKYVLKDAVVIQRLSHEDDTTAECEILDFEKLTIGSINENQLLNVVSANAFGDVAILYVKRFEESYTYGVLTGFEKSRQGDIIGYKIFSGEDITTYPFADIIGINSTSGSGVGFAVENGMLTKITSLLNVAMSKNVDAIEGGRVMLDGVIYKMAPEVLIVDITSKTHIRNITMEELKRITDISSVILYSDTSVSNGGLVRVITVERKEQ